MRHANVEWTAEEQMEGDELAHAREAAVLEERRRFADELHDTLASGMQAVVLHIDLARQSLPISRERALDALEAAERRVRACWDDARRCAAALRPVDLDERGLVAALEEYVARFDGASGAEVTFDACGRVTPLPAEIELMLLRVAQEAVTNALRHAQASTICVRLCFDERAGARLCVSDDGRGFDPSGSRGGSGLLTMRERASRAGATVIVLTSPGHGTEIILRVDR
jgi:signal transduction histidine kinase